ncbi:MAG: pyridoxamine 5'-phosphate oxidase family protein [Clostridia bacterium]|nr:pyridoxamine 5'-phosphate oxidase family protein [Clostridia bacterium]
MFRPMRRNAQAMTEEECRALLRTERRAALAVTGDEGWPYALPVNFVWLEEENALCFHCAKAGHKLDAMRRDPRVCLTVWNAGEQRGDWSYFVDSVIVFGRASVVEDPAQKEAYARRFGAKYMPTREELDEEIAHALGRCEIVKITVEHMTGKHVHEK